MVVLQIGGDLASRGLAHDLTDDDLTAILRELAHCYRERGDRRGAQELEDRARLPQLRNVYNLGYSAGHDTGYSEGWDEGYDRGADAGRG